MHIVMNKVSLLRRKIRTASVSLLAREKPHSFHTDSGHGPGAGFCPGPTTPARNKIHIPGLSEGARTRTGPRPFGMSPG